MSDTNKEPLAARLHFIPRALSGTHRVIIARFRNQLERSDNWLVLTTLGRKTGLPRQVLLPCVRTPDGAIVISTYGWKSNWLRNIAADPNVEITAKGQSVPARADLVEDLARKHELVTAYPFFPLAPSNAANRLLRPALVPFLKRWVARRPVVALRTVGSSSGPTDQR